ELVIATKVWGPMRQGPNGRGLSRKAIFEEMDKSLKRLGTDYVDLYQIHRYDYDTPLEETLEALNDLVRAGKTRYIGASEGVGVIPWSPLARGRLARPWSPEPQTERAKTDAFGKTLYEKTEAIDKLVIDRVNEIAGQRGLPPAQIALAWVLSKPVITSPIVGATKPKHLEDAVATVGVKLSGEEIKRLEELYQPHFAPEGFS
ncbi:MAG TPA: aldo/keto reductase, partial [Candidatus Baltobacteraceae bacterium]|nr:aldo/keto reductase [Candidatus Baltobacteraceae bacterium]